LSAQNLEILFRLQQLDSELYRKKCEVVRYEEEMAARQREIGGVQAKVDGLASRRKILITDRALAERKIEDQQDTLTDRRQRSVRVRTEKELRANQDEVSILQDEVSEGESRLIEIMSAVDEIETRLAEQRSALKELEDVDHRHIDDHAERMAALKDEVGRELAAREEIAVDLDASLRKRYDKILDRRQGLAVVEIVAGSCTGCNMRIPPQLVIEVLKSGAVKACPSCQRIIYAKAPGAPEAEPAT